MLVSLSQMEVEEAIKEYISSRSNIDIEKIDMGNSFLEMLSGISYRFDDLDSLDCIDIDLASNDKQLLTELLTPRDNLFASQRYIQQQKDDKNL